MLVVEFVGGGGGATTPLTSICPASAQFVGGGGGATTPLLSICPASTQTESVRLRIVAALNWRRVFTFEPPKRVAKILQF